MTNTAANETLFKPFLDAIASVLEQVRQGNLSAEHAPAIVKQMKTQMAESSGMQALAGVLGRDKEILVNELHAAIDEQYSFSDGWINIRGQKFAVSSMTTLKLTNEDVVDLIETHRNTNVMFEQQQSDNRARRLLRGTGISIAEARVAARKQGISPEQWVMRHAATVTPGGFLKAALASFNDHESVHLFKPHLVKSIYMFLVGKAMVGHTTTYENIANEFGLPNKGNQLGSTLSPILSHIYHFCRSKGQPHLTAIVVRKSGEDKDLPGKGFWDLYNAVDDRNERRRMTRDLQAAVFNYWSALGA